MPLVDGLGFEEVNQSGLSTDLVQTTSGVHTRLLAANVIGTTDISGLNLFVTGSGNIPRLAVAALGSTTGSWIGGRFTNTDGAIFPARAQGGFGARIEVGSCTTTSAGFGSAIFNAAFTNTQYFFTAQTGSTSIYSVAEAGSAVVTISGANGRGVGSVIFQGAASTPYTWIAVGL